LNALSDLTSLGIVRLVVECQAPEGLDTAPQRASCFKTDDPKNSFHGFNPITAGSLESLS
jgi:hypothetical protein